MTSSLFCFCSNRATDRVGCVVKNMSTFNLIELKCIYKTDKVYIHLYLRYIISHDVKMYIY